MSQPPNGKGKLPDQKSNGKDTRKDINCIEFTYKQLQEATKDFSEKYQLGEGGFGPVYKGKLLYTTVAIKKLRTVSDNSICGVDILTSFLIIT